VRERGASESTCRRLGRADDGSLVVELVVLTPVLFLLALAVVAFGRIADARQLVVESSRAGAQAAAVMPDAADASAAALQNATEGGSGRRDPCSRLSVSTDVSRFQPGGSVVVKVVCTVDLADLSFPGVPGTTTLSASTVAPVDPYQSVR